MASGPTHDQLSWAVWVPLSVYVATHYPIDIAIAISSGFLAGFLWLSPDVDGYSRPYYRWGLLAEAVWHRYHETHGHRSKRLRNLLKWRYRGHWPIVGSLERLVYLLGQAGWLSLFAIVPFLVFFFWAGGTTAQAASLIEMPSRDLALWLAEMVINGWFGIEAACLLHLFCDYCPLIRGL